MQRFDIATGDGASLMLADDREHILVEHLAIFAMGALLRLGIVRHVVACEIRDGWRSAASFFLRERVNPIADTTTEIERFVAGDLHAEFRPRADCASALATADGVIQDEGDDAVRGDANPEALDFVVGVNDVACRRWSFLEALHKLFGDRDHLAKTSSCTGGVRVACVDHRVRVYLRCDVL